MDSSNHQTDGKEDKFSPRDTLPTERDYKELIENRRMNANSYST